MEEGDDHNLGFERIPPKLSFSGTLTVGVESQIRPVNPTDQGRVASNWFRINRRDL